jgi:MoaA/NifB/PqqE/SkfB family radical SAM enzyme
MTTNATRKWNWYYEKQKIINQYVFSLHFEKEWERLLKTILDFNNTRENNILIHVMAHHQYMDQVRSVVNELNIFNIPYVIRRIRWTEGSHDLFDDMKYNPNDLQWIKDSTATAIPNCIVNNIEEYHANDIIKLHMNQFKNWRCNAGIESLMINWDGEVYRATCRVDGSLGNIYNDSFIIPKTPVICTRNWCTCEADIPLTKTNIQFQEKLS